MKKLFSALARPFLLFYYNRWDVRWDVKWQIKCWALTYEKYFSVKPEDFYAAISKFDIRITDLEFTRLIIDLPSVTFRMAYEASGKKSKMWMEHKSEIDRIYDDKWVADKVHIMFVRDCLWMDEKNEGKSQNDLFAAGQDIISAKHYALLNLDERESKGIPFGQSAFDQVSGTITSSRFWFGDYAVVGYWVSGISAVGFDAADCSNTYWCWHCRSAKRVPLLN